MNDFISQQSYYKNGSKDLFSSFRSKPETLQVSRHLFSKTPYSRLNVAELEIFRKQIEQNQEGLHRQPYTQNKQNVRLYKLIFLAFAFIFALLTLLVTMTSSSFTYAFFNFSLVLKTFLMIVCGLFSASSFFVAMTLRTERETVMHYARFAKKNAAKIYARKKMSVGINPLLTLFGQPQPQEEPIRQLYHETCDKISECKAHALHLVDLIASNDSLDSHTKERLYNQAIAEFNDKSTLLVHHFKRTAPPQLIT